MLCDNCVGDVFGRGVPLFTSFDGQDLVEGSPRPVLGAAQLSPPAGVEGDPHESSRASVAPDDDTEASPGAPATPVASPPGPADGVQAGGHPSGEGRAARGCLVPGCDRRHKTDDRCATHDTRARTGGWRDLPPELDEHRFHAYLRLKAAGPHPNARILSMLRNLESSGALLEPPARGVDPWFDAHWHEAVSAAPLVETKPCAWPPTDAADGATPAVEATNAWSVNGEPLVVNVRWLVDNDFELSTVYCGGDVQSLEASPPPDAPPPPATAVDWTELEADLADQVEDLEAMLTDLARDRQRLERRAAALHAYMLVLDAPPPNDAHAEKRQAWDWLLEHLRDLAQTGVRP